MSRSIGPQLLHFLPALSVGAACFLCGCNREEKKPARDTGAPTAAPAATVEAPPPEPPGPFVAGKWVGTTRLAAGEWGGVTAIPLEPDALKSDALKPNPSEQDAAMPLPSDTSQSSLDLELSISSAGELSGTALLQDPTRGLRAEAAARGVAELPEGPVRVELSGDQAHGVLVLEKKGDELAGRVRISLVRGDAKSAVSLYDAVVQLSPESMP